MDRNSRPVTFLMMWLEKGQRMLWDCGLMRAAQKWAKSLTLPLLKNSSEVNPDSLQSLPLRFVDADRPSQYQWYLQSEGLHHAVDVFNRELVRRYKPLPATREFNNWPLGWVVP